MEIQRNLYKLPQKNYFNRKNAKHANFVRCVHERMNVITVAVMTQQSKHWSCRKTIFVQR